MTSFSRSDTLLTHTAKAVYYPTSDGGLRLARIEAFDRPHFRESGWESERERKPAPVRDDHTPDPADIRRAQRRARQEAFDIIMCNPDLDGFATFTYSPETTADKTDYDETYQRLRVWLSNNVQRHDLKYLAVPELTKAGDVHFHAILNFDALNVTQARNPNTGRLIRHNGSLVYNLTDWYRGFSTVQRVEKRGDLDDPREAVAKYIFKYMQKQAGARIGGRYVLKGGALARPVEVLSDDPLEFATAEELAHVGFFETAVPIGDGNTERYRAWDFFGKPK